MLMAESAPAKQRGKPFKPGVSGNPAGRPPGSKNKFAEQFWTDFYAAWQELGPEALRECAINHPKDFCKIAAMLMPKELKSDVQVLSIFAQVKDFAEAYQVAKQHIGAQLIEHQEEDEDDEGGY
jgi:hypothetical protein